MVLDQIQKENDIKKQSDLSGPPHNAEVKTPQLACILQGIQLVPGKCDLAGTCRNPF